MLAVSPRTARALVVFSTILLVVFDAVSQYVPIGYTKLADLSSEYPTIVSPSNWTFYIWFLIFVALVAYTVFTALVGLEWRYHRLAPAYLATSLLNVVWLVLAQYRHLVWSLVVLAVYALVLAWIAWDTNTGEAPSDAESREEVALDVAQLQQEAGDSAEDSEVRQKSIRERWFSWYRATWEDVCLRYTFLLYLSWIYVAFWVNALMLTPESRRTQFGYVVLVLVVAGLPMLSLYLQNVVPSLVAAWTLVGVLVGSTSEDVRAIGAVLSLFPIGVVMRVVALRFPKPQPQ